MINSPASLFGRFFGRFLFLMMAFAPGLFLCSCGVGENFAGGGGGISGTGKIVTAIGTVNGFGTVAGVDSVIVDGIQYTPRANAIVLVEGKGAATEADLQPGMNVVLKGEFDTAGNTGRYDSIEYRSDLKGPAEGVDAGSNSFSLLGQTVLVDAATIFDGISDLEALTSGTVVEVSGTRDLAGKVRASRLFRVPTPANQVRLKGKVIAIGSGVFSIGSQLVEISPQTSFSAPLTAADITAGDDRFLEITGTLSGTTILATRIERLDVQATAADGERLEVKGTVLTSSADNFVVNSHNGPISINGAAAVIKNGTLADIQSGVKIEAAGIMIGGVIVAADIAIERENSIRLQGNIAALDLSGRSLTLNGITGVIRDQTTFRDSSLARLRNLSLADLNLADHIQLGGYLDNSVAPGRLVITRVERFDPAVTTFIQGPVSQLSPQLIILGITMVTTPGTGYRSGAIALGDLAAFSALVTVNTTVVKAKGNFTASPTVLTATELEIQP